MKQNLGGPILERDEALVQTMKKVFSTVPTSIRPQVIIETGTYLGTGTTQHVFEAVGLMKNYLPTLISIEVNESNYKVAKKLTKSHPWATFIHGSSVDINDARFFVKHDEYLLNHENYPDIYYDAEDPIEFYLTEIEGMLEYYGLGDFGGNNVLEGLLEKYKDKNPFFILDSAGGIGYLEFRYITEEMAHRRYYMFIRGINHVKHYRSYQQMLANDDIWRIEGLGEDWAVATHALKVKKR